MYAFSPICSGILTLNMEAAADSGMGDANQETTISRMRLVVKLNAWSPKVPKRAFCRKTPVPVKALTMNGTLICPKGLVLPLFTVVVWEMPIDSWAKVIVKTYAQLRNQ